MLRMITLSRGSCLRARAATSMPLRRGMAMSRMAMSGLSVSHRRRHSAPSEASPRISTPGSSSRRDFMPRRTMPWSSASRTFMVTSARGRDGNVDFDPGAGAGTGMDGGVATDLAHALLDAHEPHPGPRLLTSVDADPVVRNGEMEAPASLPHGHVDPPGA